MKDLILKRERIFHFLALLLIAVSLFVKVPEQKLTLLIIGISGLLSLSVLKKQKYLVLVYAVLIIAAAVFYYLMTSGKINSITFN